MTVYKSRKNRKRAIGGNQRPVSVFHTNRVRSGGPEAATPVEFGIRQYLSLALAAMRTPFRSRNR